MHPLATFTLPADAPRDRLDRVAAAAFPDHLPSRAAAKNACERGEVEVDGARTEPSRFVLPGQTLALRPRRDATPSRFVQPLEVVWEDDVAAVVVKPPGLITSGGRPRTLAAALPANLRPSPRLDALPAPLPAHRLDAPTSGLVVVGKTASALAALNAAFAERRVDKRYAAVVVGRLEGEGLLDAPLDGLACETAWRALDHGRAVRTDWLTLVEAQPRTGRTHQIRRHLASLGHAVVGDGRYGERHTTLRGLGLFLAAVGLRLPHPEAGEIAATVAPPAKFEALLRREARRWARLHAEE